MPNFEGNFKTQLNWAGCISQSNAQNETSCDNLLLLIKILCFLLVWYLIFMRHKVIKMLFKVVKLSKPITFCIRIFEGIHSKKWNLISLFTE